MLYAYSTFKESEGVFLIVILSLKLDLKKKYFTHFPRIIVKNLMHEGG
jgi:hypothetical protein